LAKLAVFDEELALRQQVAETYTRLLSDAGIGSTPYIEPHNVSAWAQYTIRVPRRETVQERLSQLGIPTAVHYPIPLNKQPAVADAQSQLPVGDRIAAEVMSLPISPFINSTDLFRVVEALEITLK
jgi:UDP-2-acetamido-2-deoxy-ribo-hexuluronate aminotransferase